MAPGRLILAFDLRDCRIQPRRRVCTSQAYQCMTQQGVIFIHWLVAKPGAVLDGEGATGPRSWLQFLMGDVSI